MDLLMFAVWLVLPLVFLFLAMRPPVAGYEHYKLVWYAVTITMLWTAAAAFVHMDSVTFESTETYTAGGQPVTATVDCNAMRIVENDGVRHVFCESVYSGFTGTGETYAGNYGFFGGASGEGRKYVTVPAGDGAVIQFYGHNNSTGGLGDAALHPDRKVRDACILDVDAFLVGGDVNVENNRKKMENYTGDTIVLWDGGCEGVLGIIALSGFRDGVSSGPACVAETWTGIPRPPPGANPYGGVVALVRALDAGTDLEEQSCNTNYLDYDSADSVAGVQTVRTVYDFVGRNSDASLAAASALVFIYIAIGIILALFTIDEAVRVVFRARHVRSE